MHYGLQLCQPYTIKSFRQEKALKEGKIAVPEIEAHASNEETVILKNHVEAFLEMTR